MLRAGITVVPISPRNSAPAVAHLLSKSRPSHLLFSMEDSIRELTKNTISRFKESYPEHTPPNLCAMPTFEQIYAKEEFFTPLPPCERDWSRPRLISHSSGALILSAGDDSINFLVLQVQPTFRSPSFGTTALIYRMHLPHVIFQCFH